MALRALADTVGIWYRTGRFEGGRVVVRSCGLVFVCEQFHSTSRLGIPALLPLCLLESGLGFLTRNLPPIVIHTTSTPSLQFSSIPHHLRSFPFGPSSSISVHTPSPSCVMALSSFDSVITSSSLRALSIHSQSLKFFTMSNLASLSLRTLGSIEGRT